LEFLKTGEFDLCGAAVMLNPAEAICKAALVAIQKLNFIHLADLNLPVPENPTIN